jgi:hypothetical protein
LKCGCLLLLRLMLLLLQGMQGKDLVAPKYTGIMQTIRLVTKEEGTLALWKGNGERAAGSYSSCAYDDA